MTDVLGLDIGGANIKAFDGSEASSLGFELWRAPEELTNWLRQHFTGSPAKVAITMTGELCDCFASRAEGVAFIVDSVERAFPNSELAYYQVSGRFCGADSAIASWSQTAASNWHAIAQWVGRKNASRSGVLLDVGSTTTDVIPIVNGRTAAVGVDDLSRMQAGELIYTGLKRTPVHSLVPRMSTVTGSIRLAAEWFATAIDAYLFLRWGDEAEWEGVGCDGRPLTRIDSRRRLAKMFCAEPEMVGEELLIRLAEEVVDTQQREWMAALQRHWQRWPECRETVWTSGEGADLLERWLRRILPESQTCPAFANSNERKAAAAVAVWHLLLGAEVTA